PETMRGKMMERLELQAPEPSAEPGMKSLSSLPWEAWREGRSGSEVTVKSVEPAVWAHQFEQIAIQTSDQSYVPGLLLKRVSSDLAPVTVRRRPAMLFIDVAGKWAGFRQNSYLAKAARFLQRSDVEH